MFEDLPLPSPSCPGPMCGAGWAWASWHTLFSVQLCFGGAESTRWREGSTLGCSGVAEACRPGPYCGATAWQSSRSPSYSLS